MKDDCWIMNDLMIFKIERDDSTLLVKIVTTRWSGEKSGEERCVNNVVITCETSFCNAGAAVFKLVEPAERTSIKTEDIVYSYSRDLYHASYPNYPQGVVVEYQIELN
jgi:hypothetical protein